VTVDLAAGSSTLPTTSSSGSLTKLGTADLFLYSDIRFDGGTTIAAGAIEMWDSDLFSDVTIAPGAGLRMSGDVVGDVLNNGVFEPSYFGYGWYEDFYQGDIYGDYTQGPAGMLRLYFGLEGNNAPTPLLTVSGRANLAGRVHFQSSGFIPSAGYLEWVLLAYGGVFGRFDSWTAGNVGIAGTDGWPLFLTGTLNYDANNVWFQATRVSTEAALAAASAGDAVTLDSAAHVDAAFALADALVAAPAARLSMKQRQLLASAATLQRVDDLDRAVAAFDSLSGQGHAAMLEALLGEAADAGPEASAHAADVAPGPGARRWTTHEALRPHGAGQFGDDRSAGVDRWRDDRLLVGSRIGWSEGELDFGASDGRARDRAPHGQAYVRRDGDDGRYAFASVGASHHRLEFERGIDVGAGARRAQSVRHLAVGHAYAEAGRDVAVGGHRLTAFAGLNLAALRAGSFTEWGPTGFELVAPAAWQEQFALDVGLRQARTWRRGGAGWLQLGSGATWRQVLATRGDARAAFAGAPEAAFALRTPGLDAGGARARLDLLGGGERWAWQLQVDAQPGPDAVSAAFVRAFR
jgi:hypothetical protein